MSVKIRLSRHGKKNYAFFHILATDVRAPRDSRFIELLGSYNPNTNPATIILDVDRALYWLQNGAQPTTTARRLLSYKGVLLKKHLQEGVKKGAITQETADARFNAWLAEKESKIAKKKEGIIASKEDAKKAAVEAENKVNVARAEEIAKRKAEAEKAAAAQAKEEAAEEAAPADATVETSASEAPVAETPATEAPAPETEKPAEE